MTAEIAVMNRKAVALAADSAVTIGGSGKIYSSENKLFTISKYHPIGIMIFNNAQFMNIPWEVIIKSYRNDIGDKSFDTVKSCSEHFLNWLRNIQKQILSEQERADFIATTFINTATNLSANARNHMLELIYSKSESDTVEQSDVEDAFMNFFEEAKKILKENDRICDLKPSDILLDEKAIPKLIEVSLERAEVKIKLSKKKLDLIKHVTFEVICKHMTNYTGVVFAGFGEEEYFPSITSYKIDALYDGKLKYILFKETDNRGLATIIPFAQSEMVNRFIEGIDPAFMNFFGEYIEDIINEYPSKILDSLPDIETSKKKSLTKQISKISKSLKEDLRQNLEEFTNEKFVQPIISNLDNLPLDELAEMALSLVNITSFKRKVSIDELETVGGPVDVAVITKGDGFIWIKRKHYFDPKLNHHFFNNYYRKKD
ncbi:hypothetical protein [Gracilimonas sp.]|uniref:hypothetical protein n=1 Tax=Gracilimonas sp. TaxID=1974203 RepID=UPI0032EBA02C